MTSLYNRLLIALQARLTGLFNYIELDLGQLEVYETRPAVAFPCALIRIAGNYEQRQFATQINNFTMVVKMAFDVYGNTSNLTPPEARQKALKYFDTEQQLYKMLQGWDADGLLLNGGLVRLGDADQYSEDGMRKRLVTFKGGFADNSLSN